MKIGIIGAGNVGSALGLAWLKAGHEVVFGVKDISSAKAQKLSGSHTVQLVSVADAIAQAEVVVLALPAMAVPAVAPLLLAAPDKVVIDATNTVMGKVEGYASAFTYLKEKAGLTRLVKCFNCTGAENMANPVYEVNGGTVALDMYCAGDDAEAKAVATELSLAAGFASCINFGGADRAELLEKFALAWINLAIFQGHGRNIGIKLLHR